MAPPEPSRILSLRRVVRDGEWVTEPAGRFDAHPSLPPGRKLFAFAAGESGLACVLGRDVRGADASADFLVLTSSTWQPVPLPDFVRSLAPFSGAESADSDRDVALVGVSGGFLVVVPSDSGLSIVRATVDEGELATPSEDAEDAPTPTDPAPIVRWSVVAAPKPPTGAAIGEALVASADRHWTLTWPLDAGGAAVFSAAIDEQGEPGPWRQLSHLDVGKSYLAAGTGRRLAFTWGDAPEPSETPQPNRRTVLAHFAEFSSFTGRPLATGPLLVGSATSDADIRFVAIVLLYSIGLVIVLVVRSGEDPGIVPLPAGWSLADPARRLMAGVVDLSLGILFATQVTDRGFLEAISSPLSDLLTTGPGQVMLFTCLGSLVVMGAACESLLGRTPGKWLLGCRVVSTHPAASPDELPRPPEIGAALIRNLVKWCVPPVAFLGIFTHVARHRGDVLSRSAVVAFDPAGDDQDEPTD